MITLQTIQGYVISDLFRGRSHFFPQIGELSNDVVSAFPSAVDNIQSYFGGLNGFHIPGLDRFYSSQNYPGSLMNRFINGRLFPLISPFFNGGLAGDNAAATATAAAAPSAAVNGAGIIPGYGYRPRFLRRYWNNYGLGGIGGGVPANGGAEAASSAAAAAAGGPGSVAGGVPVSV